MRVNPNIVPDILADLQQSQVSLNTALQQVSTGKSVNQPSDNPAAAAAMVQNTIETGDVDQYTQNVSSALSTVQSASSALSSVVTELTQAVSVGTAGATGTNSSANLQSMVGQVQGILSSVVSQANTSVGGVYLFGGTGTSTPYTPDPSSPYGYTYNGNSDVNSVAVGDDISVQVNVPGSQIFSNSSNNVLGSLSNLIAALQSGDSSAISSATTAVDSAVNYVGQQQVLYSNAESQLNSQETNLQQDTVSLTSQANNLIGANLATAATNLSQAEVENSAAMAAAAKVLPNTLLDYLEPPS
ncbi:MAG TPA: flagellar hook-associated protein 3 [Acidobacteriaceae bacterium]|jgi:flagellar hook-associated protein 3 FlgL|nr:flagellar hook-associated protein 3 [Acidobacteriaceae bacterium]